MHHASSDPACAGVPAKRRKPNSDRDLFLTGNLTFDVLSPRNGKPGPITPFGPFAFTSYEGAFTAGGGVSRLADGSRHALADVRFGWELHARVNAGIGIGL